jgi:hypothetical protein
MELTRETFIAFLIAKDIPYKLLGENYIKVEEAVLIPHYPEILSKFPSFGTAPSDEALEQFESF